MARHAESNGLAVDTFGAVLAESGGATLYGFSSGGTGTPVWTLPLPGCSSDLGGGTYVGLESSDSGNLVAFFCVHTNGSAVTSRVYGVNGQTGAAWFADLGTGIKAGQGQVQVTGDGGWVLLVNEGGVPTPNTATAWIFNGATGALRGNITIPFFITAAISDSGNYVAVGDDPVVHVWQWSAAAGAYAPAYDLTPPAGPKGWIPWDVQMTTGPDAAELVIVGAISGDVLTVQVTAWALVGGAQTTNWVSATNARLQENPTVRADGAYIGVSLWGDAGELPTVVLLKSGAAAPVMTAVTPGSMFAVDLAVDSSTAQQDVVYITAAGKHVPANVAGNGGDAFAWRVVVPHAA